MAMSRKTAYWMCQLGGWGGLGVLNVATRGVVQNEPFTSGAALELFFALTLAVLLTHLLRGHIRRHRWLRLPPGQLVPRILTACIVLAAAVCLVMATVHWAYPMAKGDDAGLQALIVLLLNWCLLLIGWNSIYFGVHYFEDYQRTRVEKWRLEAAVKESELESLKSQLNPHFLFNSLNDLRGLILEDPVRARQVVTQLAAVLRYSLQSGASTVPLDEELRMVRNYLSLESIRLEERLRFDIRADPDALQQGVPPMLIQGLVENGIKHGVSQLTGGGRLDVAVERANGLLTIRVRNDGPGLGSGAGSGVGLRNTAARLKLLYGDASSLDVEEVTEGLVEARVVIPVGEPS